MVESFKGYWKRSGKLLQGYKLCIYGLTGLFKVYLILEPIFETTPNTPYSFDFYVIGCIFEARRSR